MNVYQVENGMSVESNSVYIIPPNRNIKISHQTLHLHEPIAERGHNLPIDVFFHSLAKERQSRPIGIILSGTGHDGTEGIKAIKEAGGIVIAQSAESCEFDGMPSSAFATGVIDYVLAPNEIPELLLSYANGNIKKHTTTSPDTYDKQTLKKIFTLLKNQTSHDFSMYKSSTIGRRIERRLMVKANQRGQSN